MPAEIDDDEERLRLYLLKLAPKDELDRIEEIYLATSDHAELVGDAENRLVSDYVQGRLSDEEERAFVTSYLVTPERLEQVAVATALRELAEADRASTQRSVARENSNFRQRFLSWIMVPSPALSFASAAIAVLLVMTNIALFLKWRGQIRQTEVALKQAQLLRAAPSKRPEIFAYMRSVSARVLVIPVLSADKANLAPGQARKLAFRLPADIPDTVEIPIELPSSVEGAMIDASVSSSARTVWSESGLKGGRGGEVQIAVLQIPFSSLQPYLGRPLELRVVERGHAVLATFELRFSKGE